MFSSQNSQVSNDVNYIEDVFSTYLYTGNGSTQTITNGIDLAGKGGLVWGKSRSNAYDNFLADSVRGSSKLLYSNNTYAQQTDANVFSSFNSNGFSLGIGGAVSSNTNGATYVSWTFREQPKFFDVVTYTGNNAAQTIPHNLGSTPGCVIIKCTNVGGTSWWVRHRSVPGNAALLNSSSGFAFNINDMPAVSSTALSFSSGTSTNNSGETYVAYIFAHDAGGFGLTGTDNVISCGTFNVLDQGPEATINLGYEPQWILVKRTNGTGNWLIFDTMRGWVVGTASTDANDEALWANLSNAANPNTGGGFPTATGFVYPPAGAGDATYIYIAIRRGPMKVPTLGTSVFSPTAFSGNGGSGSYVNGFPTDFIIHSTRNTAGPDHFVYDRLRGRSKQLQTNTSNAELGAGFYDFDKQNSVTYAGNNTGYNASGETYIDYSFCRAPGFFDEVCYTGTGSARTLSHNLTTVPEFIICKNRTTAGYYWRAYVSPLGVGGYINFGTTDSAGTGNPFNTWNNTTPTSTVFSLGADGNVNANTNNFVAYLFATCPGVSKVGSYTGTGTLQTVACGFTSGARFVLIKRTDSTGDWYVWDSVRGISSGNDPYLLLNDTAAEVTGTNYVDTDTTGFKVTAAAPAGINASGGTYIFLAIA